LLAEALADALPGAALAAGAALVVGGAEGALVPLADLERIAVVVRRAPARQLLAGAGGAELALAAVVVRRALHALLVHALLGLLPVGVAVAGGVLGLAAAAAEDHGRGERHAQRGKPEQLPPVCHGAHSSQTPVGMQLVLAFRMCRGRRSSSSTTSRTSCR